MKWKAMRRKSNKLICLIVITVMFFSFCEFGISKNYPVLDTEKVIVYTKCDINKLQKDGKLNHNSNLIGEKVVFGGEVCNIEGKGKIVYVGQREGDNNAVKVLLDKHYNLKKGNHVIVFGEVKKPNDSIAVVDAADCFIKNNGELTGDFYEYAIERGEYHLYSYNSKDTQQLNDGLIQFEQPTGWDKKDASRVFDKKLIENDNAYLYERDGEYLGIFYFDYNLLKYQSDRGKKDRIENAIIQNICPTEKDRIKLLKMKVPQETYNTAYGVEYDAYVANGKDNKVEFQFREADGGLVVIVYIYGDKHEHSFDVVYMLSTVKTQ